MKRYEVRSWVCDWGIWDNKKGTFVSDVIDYYKDALIELKRFNEVRKSR